MFQELFSALSSMCGASSGGFPMDLNAMNAAFNANMNNQMQTMYSQMMQSNMQNPQIQQQYQMYLQQGGTLSFPAYCHRYAETGGFTPQGYANAMQTQQQIYAQDTAAMNSYRQHSAQLQQATHDYQTAVHDKWAQQRGENLSGQSPYVNSGNGTVWNLPNTAAPGSVYHDPASGNYFRMDEHGQYWMSNGQGWWQSMNQMR